MDTAENLEAWLRIIRVAGLGPAKLRMLLRSFGGPRQILGASQLTLAGAVGPVLAEAILREPDGDAQAGIASALDWSAQPDHAVITPDSSRFPGLLHNIADPPFVLYAHGRLELLERPAIAIVGSRNPTAQGRDNARAFARTLAGSGLTVVSGLALGIDTAAHEGALDRTGSTIAVLGTGIDTPYPRSNAMLHARIAESGLLLSEFGLGQPPLPHNFPRRNRIISGLSLGCLVIEASLSSGSLITARLAADQGRDVFAIPGSIHSPLSKGCHALIRQGAKLTETAQDVLEEFSHRISPAPLREGSATAADSPTAGPLLEAMGFDPVHLDILCSRLSLTPDVVSAMLLSLELEGVVAALPGGRYQRRR